MKDNGGPAFPTDSEGQVGPNTYHYQGITVRQLYKALALGFVLPNYYDANGVVRRCAELADAMIAEDREAEK